MNFSHYLYGPYAARTDSEETQVAVEACAGTVTLGVGHVVKCCSTAGHDQVYAVQHLLTIHTQLQSLALANNDLRDSEVEMLASTLKTLRCCLSGARP